MSRQIETSRTSEASAPPAAPAVREKNDQYRELARGLLEAWQGPVCAIDSQSRIVAVNHAWTDLASVNGGTADTCGIGASYLAECERAAARARGLDGVDAAIVAQGIQQVLVGSLDHFSHDYACPSPGQHRYFTVRVTPAFIGDGPGAVITHLDITEQYELERSLARRSLTDPLSDVPGWALILERLEQAVDTNPGQGVAVALISLDVHPDRDVDDSFAGHSREAVMVAVDERLRAHLRPDDTLFRSEEDRFVVVWREVASSRSPDGVALSQGLLAALDQPFDVADMSVSVNARAGVALYSPGQGVDDLLRAADSALHEAKRLGPGHVVLSTNTPKVKATFVRTLEADLRRALSEDPSQLVLHYQPVVDLTTGKVVAVESLVRWQHPTWGLLGPDLFVPLAEAAGLIDPLGTLVLQQAIRDAENLTHEGRILDLAINLSVRQLDDQAAATIHRALEGTGLSPGRLVLEVTESAFVEEDETTASAIDALSRLGVKIAIDDFGTGYSSLLYVHRYPITSLKIDREFVAGIGASAEDEAICTSIVNLAAAVGASTVAEGVETVEQYAFLRALGCRQAQGFLWSPAVPMDKLRLALASCDQVSVPAPALPTALQRRRVDENLTAVVSKRQGQRGLSRTFATALDGVATSPGREAGEPTTWAPQVGGAPLGEEGTGSMPLVLVCEDVEPVRRPVRTDLERAGMLVEDAADGHAAMGLLIQPDARRPDVIVIDCQTLPYDSWWAIAAIRAHPALDHIPALLVTAEASEHHNVEAETAGFDGIVSRPFALDDLVLTVALLAATGRQPHRRPRARAVVPGRKRLTQKHRRARRES